MLNFFKAADKINIFFMKTPSFRSKFLYVFSTSVHAKLALGTFHWCARVERRSRFFINELVNAFIIIFQIIDNLALSFKKMPVENHFFFDAPAQDANEKPLRMNFVLSKRKKGWDSTLWYHINVLS